MPNNILNLLVNYLGNIWHQVVILLNIDPFSIILIDYVLANSFLRVVLFLYKVIQMFLG